MSSRLSESLSQNIKCKIIEQDSHYQRVYAHTCKYMKIYIYILLSPLSKEIDLGWGCCSASCVLAYMKSWT